MNSLIKIDSEYARLVEDIGKRFKQMQIKAATRVNSDMLLFYWLLRRDMEEMHAEARWESKFFQNLSKDLSTIMPEKKSFSPTNLKYMGYFYRLHSSISPQLVEKLCKVPWGHYRYIIDKCKGNPKKALFYVEKIIENG